VEERLQVRLHLLARHARFHPAEDVDPAEAAIFEAIAPLAGTRNGGGDLVRHHHRHADLRHVADVDPVESLLRDADDRERIVADDDLLADHVGIAGEARLPVAVADHGHRMRAARHVILRRQHAAERGLHAEHVEERSRHQLARRALRAALNAHGHGPVAAAEHTREHVVVIAEVDVVRIRERILIALPVAMKRSLALEQHQLLRILHGQQAQQGLIDQREDRRVGAEAQRDREHRDDGEDRRLAQRAQGIAEICQQMRHYSYLNAITGFTRVARNAGIRPASPATNASATIEVAMVVMSIDVTPYNWLST
jgi:hypothetical protein